MSFTDVLASWFESLKQTQQQVDSKRREDLLYYFQAATAKKFYQVPLRPTNLGYLSARLYPSSSIDNWHAAYKIRHFFEEQTERRKASGKVVY